MRAQARWSRARWFSGFFDQRIRSARKRLSQEWVRSTTQRRARKPCWVKETRSACCGDRLIGADVRWETAVVLWLLMYWLLRRLVGVLVCGSEGERELELVVLRYQGKLLSR